MLLRQALEQTRTGKPTPVLFNSRLLILDLIDEVSCSKTDHNRASVRSFLDDSAGQVRQDQPYHKAAATVTGAQTS
jgi:hypothetical protein